MSSSFIPAETEALIVTNERLRLLSLAFYISGIIGFICASFLILHTLMFGIFSFIPASEWSSGNKTGPSEAPPRFLFGILAGVMAMIMATGWILAGLTAYAGRCVQQRKHRIFVFLMAGINLIWIPYGTLLGIAAFLALSSPEAARQFQGGSKT
jgi:hypothetical protein